ncbi:MAG: phospholipase D family protein [Verrucomicrobia bacterium]|nr:phospholipase D family protein [Verrucomicrobiota bacterium]
MNNISNKIFYPQFGEKIEPTWQQKATELAKKVAKAALIVIAASAIGFLAGGFVGAAIGAGAAVGFICAVAIAQAVSTHLSKKRLLQQLPHPQESDSKLGRYQTADIHLTKTADEGLKWKKALIKSAEESIELSGNFAGGKDFREVLALIDSKMTKNSKVKTHILISSDLLEDADRKMLKALQEKFSDRFQLLITDRHFKVGLDFHTEENHVKLLVVDGKYFVSGGTGIHPRLNREKSSRHQVHRKVAPSSRLLERSSRDSDIVGKSQDVAKTLRTQFFRLYQLWEMRSGNHSAQNRFFTLQHAPGHCSMVENSRVHTQQVRMKVIVGGPEHRANNPIIRHYEKRILKAKNKLHIANWTFCPTKPIQRALATAKKNNPHLKRILVHNGMAKRSTFGRYLQAYAGRGFFHLADKVYEHTKQDQIYHKKVATFDDTHMMIGSFNFTKKSAQFDHEIAFVIKDKRVTEKCHAILKKDKKQATKATPQATLKDKVRSHLLLQFMKNLI